MKQAPGHGYRFPGLTERAIAEARVLANRLAPIPCIVSAMPISTNTQANSGYCQLCESFFPRRRGCCRSRGRPLGTLSLSAARS